MIGRDAAFGSDCSRWSAAIAESVIASAGVEQSVIRIAGLRIRVKLHRAHRVREICDDVSLTKEFTSGAFENVG